MKIYLDGGQFDSYVIEPTPNVGASQLPAVITLDFDGRADAYQKGVVHGNDATYVMILPPPPPQQP